MRPWLAIPITLAVLAGCSKLTPENYDKIRVGMGYADVRTLLGEPAACSDVLTVKSCRWGDEQRNIKVNFVADQVVLYSSIGLK